MLERFTSATFAPLVGEAFHVSPADGEPFDLVLSACEETSHPSPATGERARSRVPFSLLFHAADGRVVDQQTFTLRHPDLGEFPLFLVPLGPDELGMRFEAVIS